MDDVEKRRPQAEDIARAQDLDDANSFTLFGKLHATLDPTVIIGQTGLCVERGIIMPDSEATVSISGIGGIFFRSKDPEGLANWYEKHFGISKVSEAGPWSQEAGFTVFSPFPADTDYFGRMDQPFMLNFRLDNLEAALMALNKAGVRIDDAREDSDYGNFAWVYDPEDNKIELWQPPVG